MSAVLHEHDAVRPRLRAQIDASRLTSLGDVDHHEMTPRVVVGPVFTRQREPAIGADRHFVWDDRSDRHARHLDAGAEVEQRDAAARAVDDEQRALLGALRDDTGGRGE